jgi:type IV secretory pathway protease TraF
MKNNLRNILLLFVSLSVAVSAVSAATPPAGTTVEVMLSGMVVATTKTDPNGSYSVKGMRKGDYVVHIAGQPDRTVRLNAAGGTISGTAGSTPAGDKNKKPAAPAKK